MTKRMVHISLDQAEALLAVAGIAVPETVGECITSSDLVDYYLDSVTEDERERIRGHVETCARCREELAELELAAAPWVGVEGQQRAEALSSAILARTNAVLVMDTTAIAERSDMVPLFNTIAGKLFGALVRTAAADVGSNRPLTEILWEESIHAGPVTVHALLERSLDRTLTFRCQSDKSLNGFTVSIQINGVHAGSAVLRPLGRTSVGLAIDIPFDDQPETIASVTCHVVGPQ